MILLPEQMAEELDTFRWRLGLFDWVCPIKRGSIKVWLSRVQGGEPIHDSLSRVLRIRESKIVDTIKFYKADTERYVPSNKKAWLVVSYGPVVLVSSPVRIP